MEKDQYPILKRRMEGLGYTVKAEINDVDLVAMKDEHVVLIEMKTTLNIPLIAQGVRRNTLGDSVYLSIPKPSDRVLKSSLFKDKCLLLKHLGLGLMLVDLKYGRVSVLFDPGARTVHTRHKKRGRLKEEFHARLSDYNTGGSNRTTIITAYRELALLALDYMKEGPETTKALRAYTQRKKVVDILQKNHYGWFRRVRRGVYGITDAGREALDRYGDVIATLRANMDGGDTSSDDA